MKDQRGLSPVRHRVKESVQGPPELKLNVQASDLQVVRKSTGLHIDWLVLVTVFEQVTWP